MRRTEIWLLALLLVGGGCAGPVASRFRVVDAVTGSPVQGVTAEGKWGMWQPAAPGLFPVYVRFPAGTGVTDNTGLVAFTGPANEVEFSSPGYIPCSIVPGWGGFKERGSFDFNTVSWDDDRTARIRLRRLAQ